MTGVEERVARLRELDAAYYDADEPLVSDEVYDALREEARRLAPDHPYFRGAAGGRAGKSSPWPKRRHDAPMPGFDEKLHSVAEFHQWAAEAHLDLGGPAGASAPRLHASGKGDGISLRLRYEGGRLVSAVTRGEDGVGEDILPNARRMEGVPETLDDAFAQAVTVLVRGEVVVRRSRFAAELAPLGYKTRRNAAGGVAKRVDGAGADRLTFLAYELLSEAPPAGFTGHRTKTEEFEALEALGFDVPAWVSGTSDEVAAFYQEHLAGLRDAADWDLDGLVVVVDDAVARASAGSGAVAWKFPSDEAETPLRDVLWQVGPSGQVTPVAVFEPVLLCGATVDHATMHSLDRFVEIAGEGRGLRVGDVLLVSRRGDVIPHVERLVRDGAGRTLAAPAACPACEAMLRREGAHLFCRASETCPAQTAGRVAEWLRKVGVKDFGGKVVAALVQFGLAGGPADLYALDEAALAGLRVNGRRYGESSAATALANLRARRRLPLHVIVGSLGIPLWGRSMCKTLVDAGFDTLEKMRAASAAQLEADVPGVGPAKAVAFAAGLEENWPEVEALLRRGVEVEPPGSGHLAGKSFCFTKVRSPEMEAAIEAAGGAVKGSVGRGLTYLVAKDPSDQTGGKLEKARAAGVQVIGVDEAWRVVRGEG